MNSPECNVCHIDLDEEEHQPRHLGCSHDACTACVKALIKNGSLECPMCRQLVKANTPEDLKINHGVVQVLRMLKEFKMSVSKTKQEEVTANNRETCRIHKHILDMRCISCKVWICVQCKGTHTPDIGCEVLDYNAYLMKLKEEHKQKVEPTLLSLKMNLKSYSSEIFQIEGEKKKLEDKFTSEISQIESEKKKLEEKLDSVISRNEREKKNVGEKQKKLKKIVDEGSKTLNEIEAATTDVEKASSSMELNQRVNISIDLQQFARIWCKKNPGSYLEFLKAGEELYAAMDINGKCSSGKVSLANGNLYLHCLRLNRSNFNQSPIVYPYNQFLNWLPTVRDLVFLDLAIAGQVQGRVTIRLRQDLLDYAKYIPLMFTGEEGYSMLDLECGKTGYPMLLIDVSSITKKMDKFKSYLITGSKATKGSVLAQCSGSFLNYFRISHESNETSSWGMFGQVESGLDIVLLCTKHSKQSQVTVQDCGLVIQEDSL